MKVQEIRELIKLIDASSINEFVYEQDGTKIEMKKAEIIVSAPQEIIPQAVTASNTATKESREQVPNPPAEPVQEQIRNTNESSANETEDLHKIISPMVGTFYQSSSPDADPFVQVGSKVSDDEVVCILEAMKLFNEITAEVKGEIVEILVKDGQLVEYGQPLFLVRAE